MSDAGGRRDIELRIRAVDSSKPGFDSVVKSINDVTAALTKELEAAAAGKRSNDELRGSVKQLEDANARLANIGALVDQFNHLTRQIDGTKAALDKATTAYTAHQATLANVETLNRTQESSLKKLNDQRERAARDLANYERSLETVSGDLRQAGIDTGNLATETLRIVTASDQAKAALGPFSEALANNNRVLRERREETARLAAEEKKRGEELKRQAQIEREAADIAAEAMRKEVAVERELADTVARLAKARADAAKQNTEAVRGQAVAALQDFNKRQEENKKRVDDLRKFNDETKRLAAERRASEENEGRARTDNLRREMQARRQVQQPTPVGGVGAAGRETIFGLRPYELQNLSYQVNDVITQLSSGAHLTQVMAQQGGQIFQLWGKNIFSLLQYLPQVVVGVTAITVAVSSLNRAMDDIQSTREFNAQFRLMANGANFNAEAITKLRRDVRGLGIDFDEAGKLINTALGAGFQQRDLRGFLELARNISDAKQMPLLDAGKLLAEGLGQGYAGVQKLQDALQFLSGEELNQVRVMFEQSKAAEALRFVIDRLTKSASEAAKNAVTPFTQATRNAAGAFGALMEEISKTGPIQTVIGWINSAAEATKGWTKEIQENERARQETLKVAGTVGAGAAGAAIGGTIGAFGLGVGAIPGAAIGGTIGLIAGALYFDKQGKPVDAHGRPIPAATGPAVATAEIPRDLVTRQAGVVMTPNTEQIEQILRVALQFMPGASAEITSARASRASGTPNHPAGMAIDARLMINGKEVPGFMGADASGQYGQLFANMLAVQQKFFPDLAGKLAHGAEFTDEDAGHFDLMGRRGTRGRAAAAAITFPEVAGPPAPPLSPPTGTGTGLANLQAAADAAKRQLDIETATTLEKEKQLRLDDLRAQQADKRKAANDDEKAALDAALDTAAKRIDLEFGDKTRAFQHQINQARESDGANADKIYQAGLAYRDKEQRAAGNTLNIDKQRAAILQGMGEARAGIQKEIQQTDQLDAAERRIAALRRQQLNERKAALDQLNAATNLKYDEEIKQLDKLSERASKVDKERYDRQKQVVEELRATELARNVPKAADQQAVDALKTRQDLIQTYTKLEQAGEMTIAEREAKTKEAFDLTRQSILGAADAIEQYLRSAEGLKETPERVALFTARIKELRAETKYVDPFWKTIKDTFQSSFASNISTAFDTIAQSVGGLIAKTQTWGDVLRSVKNAAANFFAGLLKDIATAILKYEALKLASSLFGLDTTTGVGGAIAKALGLGGAAATAGGAAVSVGTVAGPATGAATELGSFSTMSGAVLFHGGGVVGRGGTPSRAPGWWFANAPRYHDGTMVGLAPNEQAAILQRGEEVLSRSNPRNIMNGGGGMGEIAIRNVLVDDPRRIPEAMSGAHGEKVIVQTLVRNAATIRELVKG